MKKDVSFLWWKRDQRPSPITVCTELMHERNSQNNIYSALGWQGGQERRTRLHCAGQWDHTVTLQQHWYEDMYDPSNTCRPGCDQIVIIYMVFVCLFLNQSSPKSPRKAGQPLQLWLAFLSQQSSQWPPFSVALQSAIIGARVWLFYCVCLCMLCLFIWVVGWIWSHSTQMMDREWMSLSHRHL